MTAEDNIFSHHHPSYWQTVWCFPPPPSFPQPSPPPLPSPPTHTSIYPTLSNNKNHKSIGNNSLCYVLTKQIPFPDKTAFVRNEYTFKKSYTKICLELENVWCSRMSTFLIDRYIQHETISLYWDSTDMYLTMATAIVIKTLSYFDYVHKA